MLVALGGEEMEEDMVPPHEEEFVEEELVPRTDEWETMKEARIAISTVLYRRSLPFYTHQSSRQRWELRCPRIKQGTTRRPSSRMTMKAMSDGVTDKDEGDE
jgi:hypothetical protein